MNTDELIELIQAVKEAETKNNEELYTDWEIQARNSNQENKQYENSREGELLQELDETKDTGRRMELIAEIRRERASNLEGLNNKLSSEIERLNSEIEARRNLIENNKQDLYRMRENRDQLRENGIARNLPNWQNGYNSIQQDMSQKLQENRALNAEVKNIQGLIEDLKNRNFDKLLEQFKKEKSDNKNVQNKRDVADVQNTTEQPTQTNENANPYRNLSNEELQSKLEELQADYDAEYQLRVHEENGMEEHEDYYLKNLQDKISKIKAELDRRKDNPYKNLSNEELQAKLEELENDFNAEYQFRAHEENGMEEHEDYYLKNLQDKIKKIKDELNNRETSREDDDEWYFRAHQENGMEEHNDGQEVSEQQKPEEEEEKKVPETKKNPYDKAISEYNDIFDMYDQDLETLYELQKKYENEEIPYSEYEKHADYMVERYRYIMDEYKKINDMYEKSKPEKNPFDKLTDEELQAKLAELENDFNEEYQFRVHEENGMEEHEDYYLKNLQDKISKIKAELDRRKDNPYKNLSDEELQAKLEELENDFNDEYQFRAHEENGMEEHDDDFIKDYEDKKKKIQDELNRRNNKDLEKPRKPEQPMMIKENEKKDPIPPPPPPVPPEPIPEPDKLPIRSGLQVYRELVNEVGYIRGTKAIHAHDWFNKFGLIGKPIAGIIRLATGRKKEIDRIVDELDAIQANNPEDFELLMDDFLIKNNDSVTAIRFKVNEILLQAVEKKCARDFASQKKQLEQSITEAHEKYLEVKNELQQATEPAEIARLQAQAVALSKYEKALTDRNQQLETRERMVRKAREDKSYDKKSNIKGGLGAERNPDNRDEINVAANLEKAMLEARRDGREYDEAVQSEALQEYMNSQTQYTFNLKGNIKCSKGKFDAPRGKATVITQEKNMAPEILHAITVATVTAGLTAGTYLQNQNEMQQQVNQMANDANQYGASVKQQAEQFAQQTVNSANQHAANIESQAQQFANQVVQDANTTIANAEQQINGAIGNLQGNIGGQAVQAAQESIGADLNAVNAMGERTANFASDFSYTGQNRGIYGNLDKIGVDRANQAINNGNGFNPTGNNPLEKLASIFGKKAQINEQFAEAAARDLQGAAGQYYINGSNIVNYAGVDHSLTAALEQGISSSYEAQTELYKFLQGLCTDLSGLSPVTLTRVAQQYPGFQNLILQVPQFPGLQHLTAAQLQSVLPELLAIGAIPTVSNVANDLVENSSKKRDEEGENEK